MDWIVDIFKDSFDGFFGDQEKRYFTKKAPWPLS